MKKKEEKVIIVVTADLVNKNNIDELVSSTLELFHGGEYGNAKIIILSKESQTLLTHPKVRAILKPGEFIPRKKFKYIYHTPSKQNLKTA